MATLDSIDLTTNTRWINELEGSAIERQVKHTEDGRKFVFQRKKSSFRVLVFDCSWQSYTVIKQLSAVRDSGLPALLTHNDGRTFNVLLESIEGEPIKGANQHKDTAKFKVVLHFMEI